MQRSKFLLTSTFWLMPSVQIDMSLQGTKSRIGVMIPTTFATVLDVLLILITSQVFMEYPLYGKTCARHWEYRNEWNLIILSLGVEMRRKVWKYMIVKVTLLMVEVMKKLNFEWWEICKLGPVQTRWTLPGAGSSIVNKVWPWPLRCLKSSKGAHMRIDVVTEYSERIEKRLLT